MLVVELSQQMVRRENTVSKGTKNKTGQTEKIAGGLTQKVPYPNCSAQEDCLARNQLCCLTQQKVTQLETAFNCKMDLVIGLQTAILALLLQ